MGIEPVALLVVAAGAALVYALREGVRASDARRREREAFLLFDVARLLSRSDVDAALADVVERTRRELSLAGVGIELGADGKRITSGDANAQASLRTANVARAVAAGHAPSATEPSGPARGVRVVSPYHRPTQGPRPSAIPIMVGERRVGTLLALGREGSGPSREEDGILTAVAAQIGAALERERLRTEAAETEVLRRADEAKRALLHAVSHDLRTPLASIVASATSLRQRDVKWSDAERDEFLASIDEEARRLDRSVGDLLSVSRIEAGTLQPAKDWHDVGDLVEDVVERVRPHAPRHRILVDVPEDLAPAKLDQVEIAHVLTNLIENATKYAPDGTDVTVRVSDQDGRVRFDVLDRGPGVPREAAERIFRPFERVARAGSAGGTGLGLAVARSFVEAHGGRIWTEPRTDGGATFAFTLPRDG